MNAAEKAENVIGPSFVRDLVDAGLAVVDKAWLEALERIAEAASHWMDGHYDGKHGLNQNATTQELVEHIYTLKARERVLKDAVRGLEALG
jgi:hypothetical protein